jgi:hypothetical protein
VWVLASAACLSGCIKNIATGALADALSGTGGSFGRDDDPELIADALPFALKTMESLLPSQPEHKGLLAATAGGFTQYAYGFLLERADSLEKKDKRAAEALRERSKKLLERGRRYGVQGLSLRVKDFEKALQKDPNAALAGMEKEDVPLLYWTAAAWGASITLDKENLELVADLPRVEALMRRALALDETYDHGAVHELLMSYELGRPDGGPANIEAARKHLARAQELSHNTRLSAWVTWAESYSVKKQDKGEFTQLLDKVLTFPLEQAPDGRLANIIAQTHARRLKAQTDDLFL